MSSEAEDIQMAMQQRFMMLRALHGFPEDYRHKVQAARLAVNGMIESQTSLEDYSAALTGISLATLDLQIKPKSEEDFGAIQLIQT